MNVMLTIVLVVQIVTALGMIGLILLQIGMGAITAHFAVEGQAFFGIPMGDVLPYVVSRTVHTQVGIFWIATARSSAPSRAAA